MPRPVVEFWFEFASTYSYLSAMRLPEKARQSGVELRWRPFLLGPIFKAHGWDTSPFNIYAAKGLYMWQDMARQARRYHLDLVKPDPFPQNSLLAARVAQIALTKPQGVAFCQNVFLAQFDAGLSISDADVIASCLAAANLPDTMLDEAQSTQNKHALRETGQEATRHSIFGAPSFLVGTELFWGDDRLEQALEWATAAEA